MREQKGLRREEKQGERERELKGGSIRREEKRGEVEGEC